MSWRLKNPPRQSAVTLLVTIAMAESCGRFTHHQQPHRGHG